MSASAPDRSFAYLLDRRGGARRTDLKTLDDWQPTQGLLWAHVDIMDPMCAAWISEHAGLDTMVVEALLADETRPRAFVSGEGLVVVLRGVNTAPGEDPEDMVSVRVWIEPTRIVSSFRRPLISTEDVLAQLDKGAGPVSPGAFLEVLVERLGDRIENFVDSIDARLDDVEDVDDPSRAAAVRASLSTLRRQTAAVRRFLAPQREVLDRLHRQPAAILASEDALALREEADRVTRLLEDLDLARERAIVQQEEAIGWLAQEQNNRMYVLSVVAAIFLPLTFVTGLLGMNVGGIPGLESRAAFWITVSVMGAVGAGLYLYLRGKKWL